MRADFRRGERLVTVHHQSERSGAERQPAAWILERLQHVVGRAFVLHDRHADPAQVRAGERDVRRPAFGCDSAPGPGGHLQQELAAAGPHVEQVVGNRRQVGDHLRVVPRPRDSHPITEH